MGFKNSRFRDEGLGLREFRDREAGGALGFGSLGLTKGLSGLGFRV